MTEPPPAFTSPSDPMPNLRRAVKFAALASVMPGVVFQITLIVAWMDEFPDALTNVVPILWDLRDLFDRTLTRNYLVVYGDHTTGLAAAARIRQESGPPFAIGE